MHICKILSLESNTSDFLLFLIYCCIVYHSIEEGRSNMRPNKDILLLVSRSNFFSFQNVTAVCSWQNNANSCRFNNIASAGQSFDTGTPARMQRFITSFCRNCNAIANSS
mmetsp:Transcript_22148/g.52067  ORF Transcript_22148/g.52067 Transcript_22148/m.52067 type:complete len:110 (+) Transcript_22148:1883-2212(+)